MNSFKLLNSSQVKDLPVIPSEVPRSIKALSRFSSSSGKSALLGVKVSEATTPLIDSSFGSERSGGAKRVKTAAVWKKLTSVDLVAQEAILRSPPRPNLDIDFKEFLMLNCDCTIYGSPFNGSRATEWAKKLQQYLLFFFEHEKTHEPISEPLQQEILSLLHNLEDPRILTCTMEHQLSELAIEYKANIDRLTPGAKIAIPGGYTVNSTGHAVVFLIEKSHEDDTYIFRVINTGDGIRFHAKITQGSKTKHSSSFKFSSVSGKDLSVPFLEALFRVYSSLETDTFAEDTIYKLCLLHLDKSPYIEDFFLDDFITAQRSGSCSLKSQLALIRIILGEAGYKKFIFYISHDSIKGALHTKYDATLKGTEANKAMHREYTLMAVKNLMHMAEKRLARGGDPGIYKGAIFHANALLIKINALEEEAQAQIGLLPYDKIEDSLTPVTRISPMRSEPVVVVVAPSTLDIFRAEHDHTSAFEFFEPTFFEQLDSAIHSYRNENITSAVRVYIEEVTAALPKIEFSIDEAEEEAESGEVTFESFWKIPDSGNRSSDERQAITLIKELTKMLDIYYENRPQNQILTARQKKHFLLPLYFYPSNL